jgi:hypothetical protein
MKQLRHRKVRKTVMCFENLGCAELANRNKTVMCFENHTCVAATPSNLTQISKYRPRFRNKTLMCFGSWTSTRGRRKRTTTVVKQLWHRKVRKTVMCFENFGCAELAYRNKTEMCFENHTCVAAAPANLAQVSKYRPRFRNKTLMCFGPWTSTRGCRNWTTTEVEAAAVSEKQKAAMYSEMLRRECHWPIE